MHPLNLKVSPLEGEGNALLSWQVGDVKITRVLELELPVPVGYMNGASEEALRSLPWLTPHFVSDDYKVLRQSIHALLVEAPGLRLIVDTCIGNDRPHALTGGKPLATPFLKQLAEAGWSRDSVDIVLCTHLHFDHVGWNTLFEDGQWKPTFPRARYFFGKIEYDFWKSYEHPEVEAIMKESLEPIFSAGLADLVEVDHVISDEVRLVPSPGHTPGHVSVLIKSLGEQAIITGDMLHNPCQFAHPDWFIGDEDPKLALGTRDRLFADWADESILVIGTHFATPTAGRVVRDGDQLRFQI